VRAAVVGSGGQYDVVTLPDPSHNAFDHLARTAAGVKTLIRP
jgi:hypothetical protein